MAQKTEFRVLPDRLGSAGEQIASCRSKAERLAEQLAEIQRGLKGSASSIGQIERSVALFQEDIRGQAKRMNQTAEAVRFSAVRYSNAERGILGQPLLAFGSSSSGRNNKAGGSGAGSPEENRSTSQRDGGKETKPSSSKGVPSVGVAAAGGAAGGGDWIDDYKTSTHGWDGTTYSKSDDSYYSAYVETTAGADGKAEKKVTAFLGKTSQNESVSFYNPSSSIGSYKVKDPDSRIDKAAKALAEFEKKINDKVSKNVFEHKDPTDSKKDLKKDWSDRVWERKQVPKDASKPNGPTKGQMERLLTEEDKKKNSFSKDITGVKIAQWKKEALGTLIGVSTSAEGKHTSGSASISVLTGTASVSAGAGVYYVVKDGKKVLAYGADAKAGVSASALKAEASGKAGYAPDALKKVLGKDFNIVGVEGGAEAKVLHAEANAGAKARIVDGKLEIAAEGDAGAYAVKGSVSGKANLLGVKVGGSVEGNVGIGVSGKIGLTGGKLRCEFGASVGLGFKVKFDVDVQGAYDAVKNGVKAAADSVQKGVMKAASVVSNAAKSVGNAVVDAAKSVGNAVVKVFSKW